MKKETVLIIGYGSIGKKHAKILNKNKKIGNIFLLTNQVSKRYKTIKTHSDIKKINPSFIIISSRTSEHDRDLCYILKNFKNKKILVEKPLFDKYKKIKIINNHKVFVGYNLRLHPVIQYAKNYLIGKNYYYTGIYCHSYLPNWRKEINYKNSNSAKKKYGGGVLLELSHELDYLQMMFKEIKKINSVCVSKFSKLKIDVEDCAIITGKTEKLSFVVDLNFFSKNEKRLAIIHGLDFTMICDLINCKITIIKNNKKKIIHFKNDKEYTYNLEHKIILNNKSKTLCNFKEGLKLMKTIDKIKKLK